MSSAKLYVGNLSYSTTEETVREKFAAHGEVVSVALIVDRETGRPKGFGFVEMATPEQAEAARTALNGIELDGRTLKVDSAKEQQPRFGGGGRGGYGGGGYGGGGGGYGGGGRRW
ncbi:MAG: RNA-binding protein [Gaiellales bacterium]|nr:RNA-binding protein [Gaiellales bacterium]